MSTAATASLAHKTSLDADTTTTGTKQPPAAQQQPPPPSSSSKKKGKTPAEKQAIILSFFHTSKAVHVLKEARDDCVRKGVPFGDFENQLQALIDDNLVCKEKVGNGNYLWAFPSEAGRAVKNERARIEESTKQAEQARRDVSDAIRRVQSEDDKEDTPERANLLVQLAQEQALERDQLAKLDKERSDAPEMWEEVRLATLTAVAAANRWLDNIDAVRAVVKKTTGMSPTEAGGPMRQLFENALGDSFAAEECEMHALLSKPCAAVQPTAVQMSVQEAAEVGRTAPRPANDDIKPDDGVGEKGDVAMRDDDGGPPPPALKICTAVEQIAEAADGVENAVEEKEGSA